MRHPLVARPRRDEAPVDGKATQSGPSPAPAKADGPGGWREGDSQETDDNVRAGAGGGAEKLGIVVAGALVVSADRDGGGRVVVVAFGGPRRPGRNYGSSDRCGRVFQGR